MGCFGIFLLLNRILGLIGRRKANSAPATSSAAAPAETPRKISIRLLPQLMAVFIVLLTPIMVDFLGHVPPVPLKKSLSEFPTSLNGWTGHTTQMPPEMWSQVGGQSYVMIDYAKEGQAPMAFYAAYYEYQRKAGDFIHSPKLCLPGAGWFIETNSVRRLGFGETAPEFGRELAFNEMVINKTGYRQLVYYWYQGRGRNFTNEYMAKFYMVWDGIWRRRTDGALVRVIVPVSSEENLPACRENLDHLALAVSMELDGHLP
jgi:EpsI family protein